MKLKWLEATTISILLLLILLLRADESNTIYSILFAFVLIILYGIAGYFYFNSPDSVRSGKFISAWNGLGLGFIYAFIALGIRCIAIRDEFLPYVITVPLVGSTLPLLVLFFQNRRIVENKPYLKFVLTRNLIPLCLFALLACIPVKARTYIFFGPSSFKYYELRQQELVNRGYKENRADQYERGINTALEALNYSKIRGDNSSIPYLEALNLLGYSCYMKGDNTRADSAFDLVISANKKFDEVYNFDSNAYHKAVYYLGLSYSDQGHYRESDSLLKKSLAVLKMELPVRRS